MPRSLRARYVFATSMAFFDFVIAGGYVKDEMRSFFRDLLSVLEARAFQTYEGKHRPFSCIIDGDQIVEKDCQQHCRLLDFLESKESYLFANGYWTYFRISKNGYLLDYVNDSLSAPSKHEREHVVFAPSNYSRLASKCKNENIGIVLCADGEILVFKKEALILSKRKGVWHYHDQSAVVDIIKTSIEELGPQDMSIDRSQARQLANCIFASIIDVSFAHSGGCIGIVKEGEQIGEDTLYERNIKTKGCNGVQREHNKKLNNGLPILHKVPPKRDYGRYFCIMAEKGGTSHGGLTEKLSLFFHAKKQEVNAYGR